MTGTRYDCYLAPGIQYMISGARGGQARGTYQVCICTWTIIIMIVDVAFGNYLEFVQYLCLVSRKVAGSRVNIIRFHLEKCIALCKF